MNSLDSPTLEKCFILLNQTLALADYMSFNVLLGVEIGDDNGGGGGVGHSRRRRCWSSNGKNLQFDLMASELGFEENDLWLKNGRMVGQNAIGKEKLFHLGNAEDLLEETHESEDRNDGWFELKIESTADDAYDGTGLKVAGIRDTDEMTRWEDPEDSAELPALDDSVSSLSSPQNSAITLGKRPRGRPKRSSTSPTPPLPQSGTNAEFLVKRRRGRPSKSTMSSLGNDSTTSASVTTFPTVVLTRCPSKMVDGKPNNLSSDGLNHRALSQVREQTDSGVDEPTACSPVDLFTPENNAETFGDAATSDADVKVIDVDLGGKVKTEDSRVSDPDDDDGGGENDGPEMFAQDVDDAVPDEITRKGTRNRQKDATENGNTVARPIQNGKSQLTRRHCRECEKCFATVEERKAHHLAEHCTCKICGLTFDKASKAKFHVAAVHENKKQVPCPKCGEFFKYHYLRKRHVLSRECEKPKEEILKEKLAKTTSSDDATTKKVRPCFICGETFGDKKARASHLRNVHFKCDSCSVTFLSNSELKRHVACVHEKERRFKCDKCSKCYSTVFALKTHDRVVHQGIPLSKDVICATCGQGFPNIGVMNTHVKRYHLKARDYPCQYCPSKFFHAYRLKVHVKATHLGIKTIACPLCDKKFARQEGLVQHKAYQHSTEKPFVCPECGKGFVAKGKLKRHSETHWK